LPKFGLESAKMVHMEYVKIFLTGNLYIICLANVLKKSKGTQHVPYTVNDFCFVAEKNLSYEKEMSIAQYLRMGSLTRISRMIVQLYQKQMNTNLVDVLKTFDRLPN